MTIRTPSGWRRRNRSTARDLEWVEELIAQERGDATDHSLPEGATA